MKYHRVSKFSNKSLFNSKRLMKRDKSPAIDIHNELYDELFKNLHDRLYAQENDNQLAYKEAWLVLTDSLDRLKKEALDYKNAKREYKRLYKQSQKELLDYKGSRLKYKRLASHFEYKYNTLTKSYLYKLYRNSLALIKGTHSLVKILRSAYFRIPNNDVIAPSNDSINLACKNGTVYRSSFFPMEKLDSLMGVDDLTPTTLIYADLNLNIVDGSSIWLSSSVNLFSSFSNVIILSKYNIKTDIILSNIVESNFQLVIIEPNDFDFIDCLNPVSASRALLFIDELVPTIQNLVIRGIDSIEEVIKNNNFKGRIIPYLTNFYTHTSDGTKITNEKISLLKKISHQTKVWLWQTEEMKDYVDKVVNLSNRKYIISPPILEYKDFCSNTIKKPLRESILIGYAGKIQPDWGVLELIEETERLINSGYKVKLRIISSKISHRSTIKSGTGFVEKVKRKLTYSYIEHIQNVNRKTSIKLLSEVDYIWSYRDGAFEDTSLELSTKLLEGIALCKPVIAYPSPININILGERYPYYINNPSCLENILFKIKPNIDLQYLASQILENYSLENRINKLSYLAKSVKGSKLVITGHDFKFIEHFYSHLKNNGYLVYKDHWEWGEPDLIDRSKYFYKKSDVLFCEWGLANATWYSNRNKGNAKPLYVRTHLQEINPKAQKFGPQIVMENITSNIFVSERVRETALKMWGWDEIKTKLIPNYVLTDDFTPSTIDKKLGMNFGMVGITPQRKRLDRAISFMEKILEKYPNAKLYIKGERPENYEWMHAPGRVKELDYYNKQYNRISSNSKLEGAIVFDGFGSNMPKWYEKIDYILSPSDFESFHYSLADGVSSGCIPIVWNWEESEKIYSKDWIVNNTKDALKKFEYFRKMDSIEVNTIIKTNRELIIDRYGFNKVFKQLEYTLLNN